MVFFIVDGLKWIINSWLPTYFVDINMTIEEFAAKSLSYFLGSYMLSKTVFGFLSKKISDSTIIAIGIVISIIGAVVLIIAGLNNTMMMVGIVVPVFGSAVLYPFFIHYTNEICTEKETSVVIAYAGMVTVLGNIFQAIFMLFYVKYIGLKYMFSYLLVLMIFMSICFIILRLKKRNGHSVIK